MLVEWAAERFDARVEWLPFDLHPEYPPAGLPREQLVARYGPDGIARTKAFFESHGLVYEPHPTIVPNTMKALRLTEHARAQDKHGAFHDRLMDAYWAESLNIGDDDVLRALAAEVGLDGADDVLAGEAYAGDVQRGTAQAHSIGINAIPAFLLDRRLILLGAQPRTIFEQAFAQLGANPSGQ